jgi:hypothetical protein
MAARQNGEPHRAAGVRNMAASHQALTVRPCLLNSKLVVIGVSTGSVGRTIPLFHSHKFNARWISRTIRTVFGRTIQVRLCRLISTLVAQQSPPRLLRVQHLPSNPVAATIRTSLSWIAAPTRPIGLNMQPGPQMLTWADDICIASTLLKVCQHEVVTVQSYHDEDLLIVHISNLQYNMCHMTT